MRTLYLLVFLWIIIGCKEFFFWELPEEHLMEDDLPVYIITAETDTVMQTCEALLVIH